MIDLARELRLWPLSDLRARRDHLRRELQRTPSGVYDMGEFRRLEAYWRAATEELGAVEKVLRERGEG